MRKSDPREVRIGIDKLHQPMTQAQAKRYGERAMPHDLKLAGFTTTVFASDLEIHGASFYRITYGKSAPGSGLKAARSSVR